MKIQMFITMGMKVKIDDIPIEGKDVSFPLDKDELNSRASTSSAPDYIFSEDSKAELKLNLQGSTVYIQGRVRGTFSTPCARCGEQLKEALEIPVDIYLKPRKEDSVKKPEDEDVGLGFYDGEKVNCSEVAEEQLILGLPMVLKCKPDTPCGSGESKDNWVFGEDSEQVGDERFSVLKSLKLH